MCNRMQLLGALTAIAVLMLTASWTLAQTEQPAGAEDEEMTELVQEEPSKEDQPDQPSEQTDANQQVPGKQPTGGLFGDKWFLFVMIGGFILLYVWMGRGRRKQEAKRKQMITELKKGDKVNTIGGIIGTVIEVREDEVTVKVDETNNVRMKFTRRAIQGVGDQGKSGK